jgi:hypothetical protein
MKPRAPKTEMIMSQKLPWIQWRYDSLKNEMELRTVVRRIWAVL